MFHCLVINVHCFSLSLDSLFNLSYLLLFVNNFFKVFSNFFEKLISVILFQRLNYFITSSVICQHWFYIFWKLTIFSVVQKHFLTTTYLLYHTQKHSSSTFFKKNQFFKSIEYSRSASLLVHNRITASQFIRRSLHSSWYKQVPLISYCFSQPTQGTHLIRLNSNSRMPRHSCCEVRVMPEAISAGGLTPSWYSSDNTSNYFFKCFLLFSPKCWE